MDPHLFLPEEELLGEPQTAKREIIRSPVELQKVIDWVRENKLGSLGYELKDLADAYDAGIPPQKIREATKWTEAKHEGEEKALRNQLSVTDRTNLWLILGAYDAATHETNKEVETGLQNALEAERKDAELQARLEAAAGEEGKQDLGWVRAGLTLHEWKKLMINKPKTEKGGVIPEAPPIQPQRKARPEVPSELSGTQNIDMIGDARKWVDDLGRELLIKDPTFPLARWRHEMTGRGYNKLVGAFLAYMNTLQHPEDESEREINDAAWSKIMPEGETSSEWLMMVRKLAEQKRGEMMEKRQESSEGIDEKEGIAA